MANKVLILYNAAFAALALSITPAAASTGCSYLPSSTNQLPAELRQSVSAATQVRVALVIGNGAYEHVPALRNATNDAVAIAATLQALGFETIQLLNVTSDEISECKKLIEQRAGEIDVGVIFYAGHGIQIDDENYLVGVNASDPEGKDDFFPASSLIDVIQRKSNAAVVFLDACRDNPFAGDFRPGLSPALGRGLAAVKPDTKPENSSAEQARGVFVAYATSPNATASDGEGSHSPFTSALLSTLRRPGISLQENMADVSRLVGEATNWNQTPWTKSSLQVALKLSGELTKERAQGLSNEWAMKSLTLLGSGDRLEAMALALRGLPFAPKGDDQAFLFENAWSALDGASRSITVKLPIETAENFALSPSNDRALVVRPTDTGPVAQLWDTESATLIAELTRSTSGEMFPIVSPVFSSDGKKVIFALGTNGSVGIWDTSSGDLLHEFTEKNKPTSLDLDSAGTRALFTRGEGTIVKLVDLPTGHVIYEATSPKFKKALQSYRNSGGADLNVNKISQSLGLTSEAFFTSSGNIAFHITCSCGGNTFRDFLFIIESVSGKILSHIALDPGVVPVDPRKNIGFIVSETANKALISGLDNTNSQNFVALYDLKGGSEIFRRDNSGHGNISVAPDGKHFAIIGSRTVSFFNFDGIEMPAKDWISEFNFPAHPVLYSQNGAQIGFDFSRLGEAVWLPLGRSSHSIDVAEKRVGPHREKNLKQEKLVYTDWDP